VACDDNLSPVSVSANNIAFGLCNISCVVGEYNERYKLASDLIYDLNRKKLIYNSLKRNCDPDYVKKFLRVLSVSK